MDVDWSTSVNYSSLAEIVFNQAEFSPCLGGFEECEATMYIGDGFDLITWREEWFDTQQVFNDFRWSQNSYDHLKKKRKT